MSQPDTSIAATTKVRQRDTNPQPETLPPGTLAQSIDSKNDIFWEFHGDGRTTPADFVGAVAAREVAQDPDLAPLVNNPTLDAQAAALLFPGTNPNTPIPVGDCKEFSLKQLTALMAGPLEQYATQFNNQARPSEQQQITGQVPSDGLHIPIDD